MNYKYLLRSNKIGFLLILSFFLSSCANMGEQLPLKEPIDNRDLMLSNQTMPHINNKWWLALNDPTLNLLIEAGLKKNPNIQISIARLQQAEAALGVVNAGFLPQIGLDGQVAREKSSEKSVMGYATGGVYINQYDLDIKGQWNLDFFGKNYEKLQAAIGEKNATQLSIAQSQLLLTQSIFSMYTKWQYLSAVEEILKERIATQKRINRVLSARSGVGILMKSETYPGEMSLEQLQSVLIETQSGISQVKHALSALIGESPYYLEQTAFKQMTENHIPNIAVDQITTDLLGNRPDILAAKELVISKNHMIKVAKTEFYPNISLVAMIGQSSYSGGGSLEVQKRSFNLGDFFSASARGVSFGPAISLPIFSGGELRANLRSKQAEYNEQVATYNQTLLNALRDSATAITAYQNLKYKLNNQAEAMKQAENIYLANQKRVASGIDIPVQMLQAKSQFLSIKNDWLQTLSDYQTAYGNLNVSLGGGWHNGDHSDIEENKNEKF